MKLLPLRTAFSVATAVLLISSPAIAQNELFPPNAKPGECYARVFVPPAYQTETKTVVSQPAHNQVAPIPAQFEWTESRVLVKEASEKLEIIPATYEWVTEQVMVKPASTRIEVIPAQFETVSEQVLERAAHTVWKKGDGPITKVDYATGEIMCLVEVPATYKTVTRRVLKSPASTREVEVPAEYKTVRKQVMKTPPSTRKVEIPAEYETVRVQRLASPARVQETQVPAQSQTVSSTVQVSEGKMAWQPVLCETNTTPQTARSLQSALKSHGYYNGPIDGVIGAGTLSALRAYQRDQGMAEGVMTLESLKKLGVQF